VRPRRQGSALLCGPSTSPLDATITDASERALAFSMKRLGLTRLTGFLIICAVGAVSYVLSCLIWTNSYPDLPWYEAGLRSPRALVRLAVLPVIALIVLLWPSDK
jgi:hypothetical protein